VGIIGLVAYLFMIISPVIAARRAIRSRDPDIEPLALASSAGCVAYLVVNALFDTMSFPQAPYMFFIVAALATISAAGPAGNVQPARERVRQLIARRSALVEAGA
jgi:O-antigen ligase